MAEQETSAGRSDLTDLVDYPRETLDIELKTWIDLGDKIAQAKLARHIAALANYGGGYLVFGFRDDQSVAEERPTELSVYSRDTFGKIVTRYLPDYWRYAADGRATILRPYREDRPRSVQEQGRSAGSWLSPETVVRETAELVAHARTMAEHCGGDRVAFRCSWRGLTGREIDDFGGIYWSPGRSAQADQRTTGGTWEVPVLVADWHSVVSELSCPVLSLFGFRDCSAELVAGLAPRFVKL